MASFGEELRRQRELRSISLREISDATKINIRFLDALEQNDFKHLPGGQFNKGFIRAYARHIGVEGEEMVDAYLLEVRRQDESERTPGRGASTRSRRRSGGGGRVLGVLVSLVLGVGLLAVSALFVYRWASGRGQHSVSPPAASEGRLAQEPRPRTGESGNATAPGSESQPTPAPGISGAASALPPALTTTDAAAAPGKPGSGAQTAPPAPAGGSETSTDEPGRTLGARTLVLRVVPLEKTRLALLCDGRQSFSGEIALGRPLSFECGGVFEVTLDDAGAANLSLNGDRIYLGRPGQSITGRHVSAANYMDFLNPPGGAGTR